MPRAQYLVTLEHNEVAELTGNDVTAITFHCLVGEVHIIRSNTEPDVNDSGWLYRRGEGERNIALTDISSAPGARVWAIGRAIASEVLVDHA